MSTPPFHGTIMRPVLPKPQRCAIYTRKSTEHNLDLAFNSLDAQREACEAYIRSQAHREVVWVIFIPFRSTVCGCFWRCRHVGNALALSIMSTALKRCQFVDEATSCKQVNSKHDKRSCSCRCRKTQSDYKAGSMQVSILSRR